MGGRPLGRTSFDRALETTPDPSPTWRVDNLPSPRGRRVALVHVPGWRPPEPWAPRETRERLLTLRQQLRPIQRPRVRRCGYQRLDPNVQVVHSGERARLTGLVTCGSVWECPWCSAIIRRRRAEEIAHVAGQHGHRRLWLISLTTRHGHGDDLERLRRGVQDAWAECVRSSAWRRFANELGGILGTIRASEVTYGVNGWHPHLHVLVLTNSAELTPGSWHEARGDRPSDWLRHRWRDLVREHLGAEHTPLDAYGVDVRQCCEARDAEQFAAYISKLGLEVTDPGTKSGRLKTSRTPLQIAYDWSQSWDPRDGWLWAEYAAVYKGKKQLRWSRGLRAAFGLPERPDWELAADEDRQTVDDVLIAAIPRELWEVIRALPTGPAELLSAAEQGADAVAAHLIRLSSRPPTPVSSVEPHDETPTVDPHRRWLAKRGRLKRERGDGWMPHSPSRWWLQKTGT